MAIPNAAVDFIRRIEAPHHAYRAADAAPSFLLVHLRGGQSFKLDMNDRRAAIWVALLNELWQSDEPVFLEADPQTNIIVRLLLPKAYSVKRVAAQPDGDRLEVELEISHARHFLRVSNPDHPQLLRELTNAQRHGTTVLVTESLDEPEIIDVRPAPAPFGTGPAAGQPPSHRLLWSAATVTPAQAQYYFDLVSGQSCLPAAPCPTCIPFLYPRDGCYARAHEMCRLMIAAGAQPRKLWSFGALTVETPNDPCCVVRWSYHVAPILLVDFGVDSEVQVIDPALFPAPVSQDLWVGVQNNSGASLQYSDAAVFLLYSDGTQTYDPDYSHTQFHLADFRRRLMNRTACLGPPPYCDCP
jgi:hypothetical protein